MTSPYCSFHCSIYYCLHTVYFSSKNLSINYTSMLHYLATPLPHNNKPVALTLQKATVITVISINGSLSRFKLP